MADGTSLVVLCKSRHGETQIILARRYYYCIPFALNYYSAGSLYGLTIDGLGEVRVLVPESYQEQALAVLAESVDTEGGAVEDPSELKPQ